jgi:hypothetical protein
MLTALPPEHLLAYATLHELEATAQALEATAAACKRRFLHGGAQAGDEIAAALGDMRDQLQRLQVRRAELIRQLASVAGAAAPPERRAAVRPAPCLRGSTDVIAIADLVAFLASLKKTGTLSLQAPDALFVLEFQEGAVVHAATNAADPDLRLGTVLVAQNLVTEARLQECVAASRNANELLGDQLVRTATVSEADLRTALAAQVQRIFEAAFQLRHAQFSFLDGSVSAIAWRARLNTTHLLLEAARQTDERCQVAAAAGGAQPG